MLGYMTMRKTIVFLPLLLAVSLMSACAPSTVQSNLVITLAGFAVALSVLLLLINMFHSARKGEPATGNLWESRSPEWQIPSPTPAHNFAGEVVVTGDPYDYGLEGAPGYVRLEADLTHSPQPAD